MNTINNKFYSNKLKKGYNKFFFLYFTYFNNKINDIKNNLISFNILLCVQ